MISVSCLLIGFLYTLKAVQMWWQEGRLDWIELNLGVAYILEGVRIILSTMAF
jgi:hypothetical protein